MCLPILSGYARLIGTNNDARVACFSHRLPLFQPVGAWGLAPKRYLLILIDRPLRLSDQAVGS